MAEFKMPTPEEMAAKVRASFSGMDPVSGFRKEEQMLPCSDGVKLKTVCFFPTDVPGPWPTVVQRCCYPQNVYLLDIEGEEYAKRGFAMAYQMCRGTGGSEGVWEPNVNERPDGLDFVGWLQDRDWVKNMGYYGASYLALTGWAMADAVPDKMKTMYLTVYGTVRHASAWQDGLFRQDILTAWAMGNAGHKVEVSYPESAAHRPQVTVDEDLWGGKLQWYRDWITHPDPRDPYWQEGFWGQLYSIPSKLKIPVFVGEGWYDHHLGSMLRGWQTMSQEALAHSVLSISPTNHGFMPAIYGHPDHPNAFISHEANALAWFDAILKKGQLPQPKVEYYEIGTDSWHTAPCYPFPEHSALRLYLTGHSLTDRPGPADSRQYDYDPLDPVPSHGGETLFASFPHAGSQEQPGPDWRPDVLSFVSEPFAEPKKILGSIRLKLFVQTDAPDTCFAVKVSEVFPDGRAFHIRNAITTIKWNGSLPHSYDGGIAELDLSTIAVSWQLGAGSRLRVDVTSSNFPEYSVHPNTDLLWSLSAETRIARQTLLLGGGHASFVELPE